MLDDRESRNSLVALCCSYFNKSTLKVTKKEDSFLVVLWLVFLKVVEDSNLNSLGFIVECL